MPPSAWPKAVPLLVLAALLAYANCVNKTLVFDDDAWIAGHPHIDDPAEYLKSIQNRPLLGLSILALHQVGRNNPVSHHVLNVLIHVAAGLTLYGVVRRALLVPRFRGRYAGSAPYLAFAAALLWMLHPIQVQCVTYIIQRGESMAGLFYLLILYAMLRGNEPGSRRIGWYSLAVVSLVLGFTSKEILASAPAAVFLFDRIFLAKSWWRVVRRRWIFYLFFLAAWGGFVAWHMTKAAESSGGIGFGMQLTPKKYALTQAGVILYYLQISVWPRGLAIDYQSWPWTETLAGAMPEAAIVAGMLLATGVLLVWRPPIGFVCAWFFIALAPTSSVLPIVDPVFEHRLYLSLASVTVLAVFLGDWVLRAVRLPGLWPSALAAAALALGVLTYLRNEEYRTRADVWEVTVHRMPENVRARANYAHGLIGENRTEQVIPVLERALELSPADPTCLQNLAAAHELLGNFWSSAEYYRRLCEHHPTEWQHWRMYAATLTVLEDWEVAAQVYQTAGELNRKAVEEKGEAEAAEPRYGRALALLKLGKDEEAKQELAAAAAISPAWPETVLVLARGVIMDEAKRASPPALRSALAWARLGIEYLEKPTPAHLDTVGLLYAADGDFARAAEQSRWSLLMVADGPWGSLHRDRLRDYGRKRVPWEE